MPPARFSASRARRPAPRLSTASSLQFPDSANTSDLREGLVMTYPIADLDGIAPGVAAKLKMSGVRTTARFLELAKNARGRKGLAEQTGIDEKCILRLANIADKMRIKGVGEDYAGLLEAAGVLTVR